MVSRNQSAVLGLYVIDWKHYIMNLIVVQIRKMKSLFLLHSISSKAAMGLCSPVSATNGDSVGVATKIENEGHAIAIPFLCISQIADIGVAPAASPSRGCFRVVVHVVL